MATRERIVHSLPEMRQDAEKIARNFQILKDNFPEDFDRLDKKHPNLTVAFERITQILKILSFENRKLTNADLMTYVDEYNQTAHWINFTLMRENAAEATESEQEILQAASGDMAFDETFFTAGEKEDIRKMADDIWHNFFPDGHVHQFVKWVNRQLLGDEKLTDAQKLLLTPAHGIESVVQGFIDITKPETYQQLYQAISHMSGMSYEEWCDTWRTVKFTFENISTTDKIAPVLSILCAIASLLGGVNRILPLINKANCPAKLKIALEGLLIARTSTHYGAPLAKAAPLAIITGVSLKYLH